MLEAGERAFGFPANEISGYKGTQDVDGAEFWYRCPRRNCIVYIKFERHPGHLDIEDALRWAVDNDVTGVAVLPFDWSQVTGPLRARPRPTMSSIPFVPVQDRAFNATYSTTIESTL